MKSPYHMKLTQMKSLSYYYDGVLKVDIITVYLQFEDNLWYKITSCDGISSFRRITDPEQEEYQKDGDEFCYRIKRLDKYKVERFGRLVSIEEYFWHGQKDESCGFRLAFDEGIFLHIIEDNDRLILSLNPKDVSQECELKEVRAS